MEAIYKYAKRIPYELILFVILAFELLYRIPSPDSMHGFNTMLYAMTYELGFASRLFIGSIFGLFTRFLTEMQLWLSIYITLIILSALVSLVIGSVIRKCHESLKSFLLGLTLLFLASPASISYLFYWGHFGRMDTFMIFFVLLSFIALSKPKWKWLAPLFCIMAIATHQIFLFLFFPPLALVVLYDLAANRACKKRIAFAVALIMVTVVSFSVFQFVRVLKFDNPEAMMYSISASTNVPLVYDFLVYEYFSSLRENLIFYWNIAGIGLIQRGAVTYVLVSPLFIGFIYFWQRCIKIEQNPHLRCIWILSMLLPLATIPAFVFAVDWGRWFAAAFICQFMLVFYFVAAKADTVAAVALELSERFSKHQFIVGAFMLYLSAMGKFEALAVLPVAQRIVQLGQIIL